jgi:hypothetical protein
MALSRIVPDFARQFPQKPEPFRFGILTDVTGWLATGEGDPQHVRALRRSGSHYRGPFFKAKLVMIESSSRRTELESSR